MVEAEIIKTKLKSAGIPCYLKFESAGRLFGITMNGLGEVKVMVQPQHYSEALKQLNPDQDQQDKQNKKQKTAD